MSSLAAVIYHFAVFIHPLRSANAKGHVALLIQEELQVTETECYPGQSSFGKPITINKKKKSIAN